MKSLRYQNHYSRKFVSVIGYKTRVEQRFAGEIALTGLQPLEFMGTVLTPDGRSVPDRSENCVF